MAVVTIIEWENWLRNVLLFMTEKEGKIHVVRFCNIIEGFER